MARPTRNTKRKNHIKIEKDYLTKLAKTKGQPEAKRKKKLLRALSK